VDPASLISTPGGGDPCDILNGRLQRPSCPPPLALAASLPLPSVDGANSVASPVAATCDIALQYQRLFEEQRDLSPLTHFNNHCATTATADNPAAAPTAKCPPPSPLAAIQQRRMSATNNGTHVAGGNIRAAKRAPRRRSSASVPLKAGKSPVSPPSTYLPPPCDFSQPLAQSTSSYVPVSLAQPYAHICGRESDWPEMYLRNGETYIGPDHATTLPHRVSYNYHEKHLVSSQSE